MSDSEGGKKGLTNDEALELARKGMKVWNAWATRILGGEVRFTDLVIEPAIRFSGFQFPGIVNFRGTLLFDSDFKSAIFNGEADFREAKFSGQGVGFHLSEFKDQARFTKATFRCGTRFVAVTFKEYASFAMARFEDVLDFHRTAFESNVTFAEAVFEKLDREQGYREDWLASFTETNFKFLAEFRGSRFGGNTTFAGATFGKDADFRNTVFMGEADFSGATFKGPVSLEGCRFAVVPDFRRCKFDKHVTLHGCEVEFRTPRQEDADKYRRLKELAVAARNHDQEQYFFACELKAKRGFETRGLALVPNHFYEWTSNFGRSLARPTLGLGVVWFGFGDHYRWLADKDYGHLWDGLLFSAAQLLPFLGASRGVLADAKAALFGSGSAPLSGWVNALTMIEGVLGIVFLFLIGLALRNRFRI
ncbi:pentapeptide repeat-containing protein [Candidatus Uhrbacteria bacterium]|nr:pentapeptide repeat-containing protein [Candidatus Uhrbacteria bacterium]